MKIRSLCALALFAGFLLPASANAQAPSGSARVDSDTYFNDPGTSWGYRNDQNNFTEPTAAWPEIENNSSGHAGLLGKTYVRGAYLYNGVDDNGTDRFDALEGFDVEFNTPIPWISSNELAVDFATEFEHKQLDAQYGAIPAEFDFNFAMIGARLFAMPNSRVRPYILLGALYSHVDFEASNGASFEDEDWEFVVTLGIEADIASNASIRGDFEIDRDEIDESTFEGTVVVWLGENIFFRGGGVIPLTDGFDPGVTIGGGVAFR